MANTTFDFTIVTYNIFFKASATSVREDLTKLFAVADAICFQEFAGESASSDDRILSEFCRNNGWQYFRGSDGGTPIAWKTSVFKRVQSASEFLSNRTRVLSRGAGPNTMFKKWSNWVKLQHVDSGRYFYLDNGHFVPSIQFRERSVIHVEQTRRAAALINRQRKFGNVIFCGDLNIDYKDDKKSNNAKRPRRAFAKVNTHSNWDYFGTENFIGTHDTRYIDYQYLTKHPMRFWPIEQEVLTGFNSDHRPLRVKYRVTQRSRYVKNLGARRR